MNEIEYILDLVSLLDLTDISITTVVGMLKSRVYGECNSLGLFFLT